MPGGLVARPGLPMAFYPLGSTVVVRHVGTAAGAPSSNRQAFLVGHEHTISCVALSHSGKYLVTGEKHDVGTKVRSWGRIEILSNWAPWIFNNQGLIFKIIKMESKKDSYMTDKRRVE